MLLNLKKVRFWKFITSNKYLDERKIKNDEILLKNYYQKKGYYNVNVKSSYAKNINNEYFELIFNIDSGENSFLMNINLNFQENFKENFVEINKKFEN